MKDGKKNTVLLTIIGIATLLVAVVGATFAYFSAVANGNNTASTIKVTSGKGGTSGYSGGEAITLTNIYPRAEAWVNKKITVTYNSTTGSGTYTYHFNIEYTNNFAAGQLTYTFTGGYCSVLSATSSAACTTAGGTWTANSTTVGTPVTDVTTQQSFSNGSGKITTLSNGTFTYPTAGEVSHSYVLSIFFPDTKVDQNTEQGKTFTAYVTYGQVS
jgi:predicted ribosomally synthesized peptide with SipW-like signal peptide